MSWSTPQDLGALRGGVAGLVAGLAFGLPWQVETEVEADIKPRTDEPTLVQPRETIDFTIRDLKSELANKLNHTRFEVVDCERARDGVALCIQIGRDPLLYYRNKSDAWGERYDDEQLKTVEDVPLQEVTLARLAVHVAWNIAHEHFKAKRRSAELSMQPNAATEEAIAFLRDAAKSPDESERTLAIQCLSHLQAWSPEELKVPLGFAGASHETLELLNAVIRHMRAWLSADSVQLRSEPDGSCLLIVEYSERRSLGYRLSPSGEWSLVNDDPPLITFDHVEIREASVPQVVTHIAVSIAFSLWLTPVALKDGEHADWSDPDTEAVLSFLRAVHDGTVEGFESAQFIAKEYLDWLTSRDAERLDVEDIDLSFFEGFELSSSEDSDSQLEPPKA